MYRLKRSLRAGMSLLTILSFLSSTMAPAFANPLDGQVVGGQATISGQGTANVTINQSTSRAAIDWRSFSIDHGEQTQFIQPDSNSLTLNRVTGADPSRILGSMSANGTIILVNPNGVVFGLGSKVDAAGLVATTHDIDKNAFMAGGPLRFNQNTQAQPGAGIVNEGTITIRDAGVAALVAPQVRNSGLIVADGGVVNLAAGQGFALDLYGDKLVSFGVNDEIQDTITDANGVPVKALVENDGTIQASGGKILLTANAARQIVNQAINVTGTLAASHATRQGGKIILSSRNGAGVASGVVNVGNAKIEAKGTSGGTVHVLGDVVNVSKSSIDVSGRDGGGVIRVGGGKQGGENLATATTTTIDRDTILKADATQTGKGGNIVVWADDTTDYQGSLSAKGGAQSGDGGFAEVSGKRLLKFKGQVDLTAAQGKTGDLLLDPQNLTIQNSAGSPAANCVGSTCTPGGDSSILTVADLENLLLTSNVTVSTGASGAQAGDITVADNITWTTGNRLMLDAHGSIIINGLVTIKNTYTGTFGANDIPVLLSLRADATGANNGGSFTNNGTIDFSGSNGAVSIFYDRATYGGSYTAGTQSQKTGWAAPANLSVSNQFTAYQLINNVTDLAAISGNLAGNYALGKNIDGGGLAFNGDVPLGTFTGKLDGQYCALSGGANCSITNLTLTPSGTTTGAGLFSIIDTAGVVRNLTLGLTVTQNYTIATANFVGALAGTNRGTIANVTSTGSVDYTYTGTVVPISSIGGLVGLNTGTIRNAHATTGTVKATSANGVSANISTFYVGGLVGQQQTGGTITNSTASQNVSYVYKGQSTGASVATVGGLIGYNISTTANSVSYSSASGAVNADYFSGYDGNVSGYLGGLIGQNGNNTATSISNVSATGAVGNTLHTATTGTNYQIMGGLIGWHNSNLSTSGAPSISTAFATGAVTYNGTTMNSGSIGGLIGSINNSGWVDNVYATGAVSYTGNTKSNVAGLIGWTNGSVSNAYATGAVSATYNSIAASTTDMNVAGLIGQITGNLSNSHATGNVSAVYNSATASSTWVGGLVGQMAGNITNSYTETGQVTLTSQVSGTSIIHTGYVGGLVGQQTSGAISGSTSSQNVSYVYKGTSTGVSVAMVGGLVGYNISPAANSVSTSSADGDVTADYFSGFSGNVTGYIGGLIGQNGGNTATSISNVSATGDVSSTLGFAGASTGRVGGLIGLNYSNLTTSASPSVNHAFATGKVTYIGLNGNGIGGLIGYNQGGWINDTYATGNVLANGAGGSSVGGLIGNSAGGVSNSHASGNVDHIFTGNAAQITFTGGLIGYLSNTLSDSYSDTGKVTLTSQVSGTSIVHTAYVGGLVGHQFSGAISGSTASQNVSYVYKGTSTGVSIAAVGGLVGYNISTTANSVSGSSASGTVSADYFSGYNGDINGYIGGLVGWINGAVSISNVSATGSVSNKLHTLATGTNYEFTGGLVGRSNSSLNTAGSVAISNAFATGHVTYDGTTSASTHTGGLIGYNESGWLDNVHATGNVSYTGSSVVADTGGLIGSHVGAGLTNAYTQTGEVKATNITSGSVVSSIYVGGLIGYTPATTLTNVSATQNVSYVHKSNSTGATTLYVAGLIGYKVGTGTITGTSFATGNVLAENFTGYSSSVTAYVGGLIGQNGNATGAITITGATASGNVTDTLNGSNHYLGGLIGYNASSGTISDSTASGDVSYNGAGNGAVGGFVGYDYVAAGSITNSTSSGSVANTSGPGVGAISYLGGFAGLMTGTLTGSYSTNTDDVIATSTATGTGVHTFYVGGQVGYLSKGTIANVNSSAKVSYVYKGTSSGIHILAMGGLVGLNASTTANSISASSSTGNVSADYFTGYDGTITTYIGGLIGQNGNSTATSITNVSATGDISNKLRTVASGASYQLTGGLIGWNYSTLTTSASPSVSYAFATGKVTYEGTTTASGASTNVAGLVGYNQTGWLDHVYATGNVSYIGSSPYVNVGGLTSSSYSGISNAYAKGNIDVTYTGSVGSTLRVGGLVGYMEGAVSDSYTQDGKITVTSQVTGTNIVSTTNVGGLVAVLGAGKISNSTSSEEVSYVYKGTSTGTSVAYVGGLLGYNLSTTANSVSASSASGKVSADYFTGYTGNVTGYIGGAIGSNGNTGNIALSIDNVSASGDVSSKLQGSTEYIGGLIGYHYSNLTTSTSPSINNAHATGKVTYSNTAATAANVGGLIGYSQGGWINNADATGETSYTGLGSANIGGLIGQNAGGLSNAWATGAASYTGPATSSVGGLIGSNTGVISTAYAKGNVSNTYTGSTAVISYTGGLIGSSTNNVTDSYTEDGAVTVTSQVSGTNIVHTSYVGGLIGQFSGSTLTNVRSNEHVSFVYKGTSTGASLLVMGGLIGYNSAVSTLSGTSSASGNVKAENFTGYNGVVGVYAGGLIGQNGINNAATITGATASGNVTDTLNGGNHNIGGLIGYNNSSGTISGSSASGDVSYNGTGNGSVGGFVGYDAVATGSITNSTSSGSATNTSGPGVAATSYLGGFAGLMTGTLTGSYSTNTDDIVATSMATVGVHTFYVGGQVGHLVRGSLVNVTSGANVSYVYKGTSVSTSVAYVGGLVGLNASTTTNSISGSSATGDVTAGYFSGFTGNVSGYIGGAIGTNNGATSISGVSATGDVRSTLVGGTEYMGGLIGHNYSTLTTSVSPSVSGTSFATGDVSYIGASSAGVGGLIGYNQTGWIDHVYATGDVSYNGGGTGSVGGLIGSTAGSISNAYAKGNVENIYTGSAAVTTNTGGLVGVLSGGTIADSYTEDGTVTVTAIVSGTGILHTAYVGGLVGNQAGAISNSTSSQNVSFVYKGTTTGLTTVSVGGLVGYNITPGANITGSSASGDVNAGYFTGYTGDVTGYIGGLIGRYGNNNAISVSGSSASGDVRSTLVGGTEYVGGLIGWSNSNLSTSVSPGLSNVFATGDVSYEGTSAANVGGLVGNNPYSWIDNAHATGKVSYTGSGNATIGGLIGSMSGGVSNSYATGDIETLYLGTAAYTLNIGGLIGSMNGVLSDSYAEDGAIIVTIQNSGTLGGAAYVGGLAGQLLNNATNVRSAQNVSYVYKGTSNGLSSAYLGGLVGLITTTNTSITNGSASGDVIANYATGYTGNVSSYMGGLIGQYGQNTAVAISNASATGDVRSTLTGGTEYIGGLIGWLYSTRTTSGAPALSNVSATGHVFYDAASNANVGGLVGYNQGSWIDKSYATGNVGYNGAGIALLGGLIGNSTGSVSNAYAMGMVDYQGASASSTVGGLVGTLTGAAVERSFATGYVKNGAGTGGGLVASKNVSATITDSYWDQDTTGLTASAGGSGLTTTQLQATLQGNFSSSDWAILAGISYPYLKWQLPSGTAQIVSGYTYSDTDETLLKGAEVGLAVDGVDRDSALTNGHVYSGANGYYYYFLAPNTISGGGSDLLAYLPGTVKANTIHTGVTGSVDDLDLYGGWLNIASNKATLSGIMSGLAGIANGSNDILFTLSGSNINLASGTSLGLHLTNNSTDLDMDLAMASGSMLLVDSDHDVTQSAAITADELVLTGTGDFALTNTDNAIGTLAANVSKLELNNGSADLVIGSLWGIDGVTADDVYLTTTGHVTQSEALIADNLLLSGVGSIYDLDHVDNAIGTLAANAGTINLHNGSHDLMIGSVNNVDGVTADDLYLTTTGEVTQTEAIIADNVSLAGVGSLYDLDHADNAIGTLAASVGTLNLNNGSADLVIGAVNNVDGITADDVYLTMTGEVTQTEAIIADNLFLSGTGSVYDLDHNDNAIGTLAAHVGTLSLNNGSADLIIGSVNHIDGVTADDVYLTTTGHVTQTEALIADHIALSGVGSFYDLDHNDNAIGTLAAHVETLNLNNGSADLVIGAVNNIDGITADDLYLATTGHVTQTKAIIADHVSLTGVGSIYDLTQTDNAIGTVAAHAGRVDLDNGGHDIVVGSFNNIDGITTTDKTSIANAGHIIINEAISASGTGDTLVLAGTKFTNNKIGANALDAGTGRFLVWSVDPANDAIGDLVGHTQYNATYGVTAPTDPGNSFLYSYNPAGPGPGPGPGSDPVKIVLATAAGATQLHQMTSLLSAMPIAANVPTVQSDVMVDADVDVSCNPQTVTSNAQSIAISCTGGAQ